MAASSSRRNNQRRNANSYAEDASRLIRENMKCPVCLEVLLPPIYQCETGHNICYLCVDEVSECPLCKSDYGDTRNYFAEELVNSTTFPCKYEEYGCHKTFLGSQLKDHQTNCECQPYRCPELACQEVVGIHQMAKHLDKHGFKVMKGDVHQASVEILDDHFERKTEYNPWRISAFGAEFYTVSTRNREGIWHFWVYGLGLQKELRKYSYEIVLYSDEKQIMYRGVIQSLRNSPEIVMKNGNCLITTDQIIKSIRKNGRIRCQLYFIQGKNWDKARNTLREVKRKVKNAKIKSKKIKSCPPKSKEKLPSKKNYSGSATFTCPLVSNPPSISTQLSLQSNSQSRSFHIGTIGSSISNPINMLKKELQLDLNGNKVVSKLKTADKLVKAAKALSLSSRATNAVVPDDESSFVERVRDTLRCPSCNEVITPPVFQCLIGHNVCHKCRMTRQDCSLCLSPLTDGRNFFAEELLYKTCQRCLYSKNGCKVCLPTAQMKSHEAVCDFAPFECPFNVCRTLIRSDDLLEHMKTHQVSTVQKELKSEVFVPRSPPSSAVCITPNILTVDKVAFYPIIVREKDGSWLFYVITNNYSKYRYEILIKKQSKTLAFQGPVLSLRCNHSQVKQRGNALVVTDRAVKGLKTNDKLVYQIRIKNIDTTKNERTLKAPTSWVLKPRSGEIVSKTELFANKKTSVSPDDDSESDEEENSSTVQRSARGRVTSDSEVDDTQSALTASTTSLITSHDERESEFETYSKVRPKSNESNCSSKPSKVTSVRRNSSEKLGTNQKALSLSPKKTKKVTLHEGQQTESARSDEHISKRNAVSSPVLSNDYEMDKSGSSGVDKNNNPTISRKDRPKPRLSLSTESLTVAGKFPPAGKSKTWDKDEHPDPPISILKCTENPLLRAEPSVHNLKTAKDEFYGSHSSSFFVDPFFISDRVLKHSSKSRSRSSSKHRVRVSDQVICLNDSTEEEDVNANYTSGCCRVSQTNLHGSSSKSSILKIPSKHVLSVQQRQDRVDEKDKNSNESHFQQLTEAVKTDDATANELMEESDLLSAKSFNEVTEAVISGGFDVVKSMMSVFTSQSKEDAKKGTEPKKN